MRNLLLHNGAHRPTCCHRQRMAQCHVVIVLDILLRPSYFTINIVLCQFCCRFSGTDRSSDPMWLMPEGSSLDDSQLITPATL